MYKILILPIIAGLIAQIIKFILQAKGKNFSWKDLVAYSGMPSGHTAMVISLAVIIALEEGLHSPIFAFSVIFAIIIIRDALGFRKYLGQHGKIINVLVKDLGEDRLLDKSYPHLLEKIGHTPLQVLIGGILGFAVSLLGYLYF